MENPILYHFDINLNLLKYLNINDIIRLNKIKHCECLVSYRNEYIFTSCIDTLLLKFGKTIEKITMWMNYHRPYWKKNKINFLIKCSIFLSNPKNLKFPYAKTFIHKLPTINQSLTLLLKKTMNCNDNVIIKSKIKPIFIHLQPLLNYENNCIFKNVYHSNNSCKI